MSPKTDVLTILRAATQNQSGEKCLDNSTCCHTEPEWGDHDLMLLTLTQPLAIYLPKEQVVKVGSCKKGYPWTLNFLCNSESEDQIIEFEFFDDCNRLV